MTSPQTFTRTPLAGRYQLLKPVDQDGARRLWLAQDIHLRRWVTARRIPLPPGLAEEDQRHFAVEVLSTSLAVNRLGHDGIPEVYETACQDGCLWIVTERYRARSIEELLQEQVPLDTVRVARTALAVMDMLGAAHRQGVVHGGVDASCVLVRPDGRAVLTEFGVAAAAAEWSPDSARGDFGTTFPRAPEQARGQSPCASSDLWAVGALLATMIKGREVQDGGPSVGAVPSPRREGSLALAIEGLLRDDPAERLTQDVVCKVLRRLVDEAERQQQSSSEAGAGVSSWPTAGEKGSPAAPPGTDPAAPPGTAVAAPPGTAAPVSRLHALKSAMTGRSRHRNRVLGALAAGVVLITVASIPFLLRNDGSDDGRRGGAAQRPPVGTPSPGPSASSPPAGESPGLPEGFSRRTDPEGFSIALPEGWQRIGNNGQSSGSRFGAPGDPRRLLVDWTHTPGADPQAAWVKQEARVRAGIPGYRRIGGIRAVDYRGWKAADWEWTFVYDHIRYRTLNRGFVVDAGHGYAIKWSVPEADWDSRANQRALAAFLSSFQPAD
ncbi:serine/threonine protein kinase [Streptomyces sp. NPDC048639]|uniref:serine/threonine protein kinase n=1 Tax=Streptomyces sp. NPDC048639 TaxID=3365581 RepID=UPI00371330FE